MTTKNIYSKLKPPEPTPEDEICKCKDNPPVKLMYALSFNPVNCINCNQEVPPETLGMSEEIAQEISFWCWIYSAVDHLWLASGEYEAWAERELSDISSPINRKGREAQAGLNTIRRCYYWYFQNQSEDNFKPITDCPVCGEVLVKYSGGIFAQLICQNCNIITVGE